MPSALSSLHLWESIKMGFPSKASSLPRTQFSPILSGMSPTLSGDTYNINYFTMPNFASSIPFEYSTSPISTVIMLYGYGNGTVYTIGTTYTQSSSVDPYTGATTYTYQTYIKGIPTYTLTEWLILTNANKYIVNTTNYVTYMVVCLVVPFVVFISLLIIGCTCPGIGSSGSQTSSTNTHHAPQPAQTADTSENAPSVPAENAPSVLAPSSAANAPASVDAQKEKEAQAPPQIVIAPSVANPYTNAEVNGTNNEWV